MNELTQAQMLDEEFALLCADLWTEDDALRPEDDRFTIDDDAKADWAIRKINETNDECERLNAVRRRQIEFLTAMIRREEEKRDRRTSNLTWHLERYFDTVPHRETKTLSAYDLPSGKLQRKKPTIKLEKDDDALTKWLATLDAAAWEQYTETVVKPRWSEFKKALNVTEDGAFFEGEKVEGVSVVRTEPTFKVVG